MSDLNDFAAMQDGDPVAAYKKTVPSKLGVYVLSPYDEITREYVILRGEGETATIKLWSDKQTRFFREKNRRSIEQGKIIPCSTEQRKEDISMVNQMTDAEIREYLDAKFLKLSNKVEKVNSVALMYRFLNMAEEMGKSEKIIGYLQGRLSEIQGNAQ